MLQVMLSLPGSRRSLKVCMLITASVFTITGGWGLCLTRRWQVSDSRISSAMALQKERWGQRGQNAPLLLPCSAPSLRAGGWKGSAEGEHEVWGRFRHRLCSAGPRGCVGTLARTVPLAC